MVAIPQYDQRMLPSGGGFNPISPNAGATEALGHAADGLVDAAGHLAHEQDRQRQRDQMELDRQQKEADSAYWLTNAPGVTLDIGQKIADLKASSPPDGSGYADGVRKVVEESYARFEGQGSENLQRTVLASKSQALEHFGLQAVTDERGYRQAYAVQGASNVGKSLDAIAAAPAEMVGPVLATQLSERESLIRSLPIAPDEKSKLITDQREQLADAALMREQTDEGRVTGSPHPSSPVAPAQIASPADFDQLSRTTERLESHGKPNQVSHDKNGAPVAYGVMQLTPGTGAAMARKLGAPFSLDRLLHDDNYNRTLGREYLREMVDRYHGNPVLALAAYHSGPGVVDELLARNGDPTKGQVSNQAWAAAIPEGRPALRDYIAKAHVLGGQATQTVTAEGSQAPNNPKAPAEHLFNPSTLAWDLASPKGREAAMKARQDQVDKQNDNWRGELAVKIDRGAAGDADIDAGVRAGRITEGSADWVSLKKQAQDANLKAQAAAEEAQRVEAARRGAATLDPGNEKDRKALDTDFTGQAAGWKPEEFQARTAAYVHSFGIVPASVRGMIEGGLRSSDPDKVLAAANFYDQVRAASPAASRDFTDGEIGRAELLLDYQRTGLSAKDAMATLQVSDKLGKDEIERRDLAFGVALKQAKYDPAKFLQRMAGEDKTLNGQARGWFGLTADGKSFKVPPQMEGEVRDTARRLYRTTGSVDASMRAAWQIVRHSWQPSMVMESGPKSFAKNSPELLYGRHDLTIEQNARWIREQAANEIEAAHAAAPPKDGHLPLPTVTGLTSAGITATAGAMRAGIKALKGKGSDLMFHEAPDLAQNGQPVYYVSRMVDGHPRPVTMPDGGAYVFQPHYGSSAKAARQKDRAQERERDASDRRRLIEQSADYPMAAGAY